MIVFVYVAKKSYMCLNCVISVKQPGCNTYYIGIQLYVSKDRGFVAAKYICSDDHDLHKAELLLNRRYFFRTQFSSLGVFINKKIGNQKD